MEPDDLLKSFQFHVFYGARPDVARRFNSSAEQEGMKSVF